MTKLGEMAAQALARDPAQPALEFGGKVYTWGEMQALAQRVQTLIAQSGALSDAPIAFIARNRPSAAACLLALMAENWPIRMVFAFQSSAAIAAQLDQLQPAVAVIMAEDDKEDMRAILRKRGLAAVVLDTMGARVVPECEKSAPLWQGSSAPAEIHILTSGTTGPPKQFPISYELISTHFAGGQAIPQAPGAGSAQVPPPFLFYPIGNVTGLSTIIQVLIHGTFFILLDRFDLGQCMDYLRRYRPVALHLPPAAVQMVLDADVPAEDFASVRWIPTGAAPLHPEVQRAFEKRYGIPILSSYGATEFAGAACVMTPEHYAEFGDSKFGSIGRPLPGIAIRVVDPQTGAALPTGEEGIIEAKVDRIGPNWIRTADLAVIDEDGFLFHRGRADGAITRGGFKVLPETIVTALLEHESVSAAGVVGIPDQRLGQVPVAVIELKAGARRPDTIELERHMRNRVLATHIPTAWRFVEELPKNPSFKIDRGALQRLFDA